MTTKKKRQRPAPRTLDRERITAAALARIESGGLAAFSLRKLAGDLGCEAMSLYHHVAGADGVLDAVVDRMFGSILAAAVPGTDPRQSLESFAKAYLAAAEAYPNAFPLLATRLLHTPRALAAVGHAIGLLRELGLGPRAALAQARVLAAYLNGAGLALCAWRLALDGGERSTRAVQADAALARLGGDVKAASVLADLEAGLERLLDAVPIPPPG